MPAKECYNLVVHYLSQNVRDSFRKLAIQYPRSSWPFSTLPFVNAATEPLQQWLRV